LNVDVVNAMLLAVQKGNLELSIKLAVVRSVFIQNGLKRSSFST
jgi:hypothetical protein